MLVPWCHYYWSMNARLNCSGTSEEQSNFVFVERLFIVIRSQYLHSLMALMATDLDFKKNQKRLDTSTMALEALRNVIKNNPGKKRNFIDIRFAVKLWRYSGNKMLCIVIGICPGIVWMQIMHIFIKTTCVHEYFNKTFLTFHWATFAKVKVPANDSFVCCLFDYL